MDSEVETQFKEVLKTLAPRFGDDLDMQALLFLIGVQELGKGPVQLNKNAKIDVMHIAICTLLEPFGFYKFDKLDDEGWPHWTVVENLPPLKSGQQLRLMKQAIVDYFKANKIT